MAASGFVGFINKVDTGMQTGVRVVTGILIVLTVVFTAYTVFMRYLIEDPPFWGDTLTLFANIWLVMMALSLSIRNRTQISMTALYEMTPARISFILEIVWNSFHLRVQPVPGLLRLGRLMGPEGQPLLGTQRLAQIVSDGDPPRDGRPLRLGGDRRHHRRHRASEEGGHDELLLRNPSQTPIADDPRRRGRRRTPGSREDKQERRNRIEEIDRQRVCAGRRCRLGPRWGSGGGLSDARRQLGYWFGRNSQGRH